MVQTQSTGFYPLASHLGEWDHSESQAGLRGSEELWKDVLFYKIDHQTDNRKQAICIVDCNSWQDLPKQYHRPSGLNTEIYILTILEAGRLRSRCWQDRCPARTEAAAFWLCPRVAFSLCSHTLMSLPPALLA